uniref:POLO box domain-containing protein n=1 Tax=Timema monikensis TaxID=170555 RepID=A0A7R9HIY3_9NEOP|nr:unnamed protein product [Timema monikensis]
MKRKRGGRRKRQKSQGQQRSKLETFIPSRSCPFQLLDDTVRMLINFTNHTKVILCPLMMAVTYIDAEKNFRTFRYSTITEQGCCMQLGTNLKYALDKIQLTLSKREKQ